MFFCSPLPLQEHASHLLIFDSRSSRRCSAPLVAARLPQCRSSAHPPRLRSAASLLASSRRLCSQLHPARRLRSSARPAPLLARPPRLRRPQCRSPLLVIRALRFIPPSLLPCWTLNLLAAVNQGHISFKPVVPLIGL